jgi:D-alanyl-D-alanine carboxypeptidase
MQQWFKFTLSTLVLTLVSAVAATANPTLIVDADSGQVLHQQEATASWFPASLTKLMTVYVALHAVQNRSLSLDTPLTVSARAYHMAPSKMGFKPGTEVTLDNALKMLMVKSANDLAVTIAEGVSGSVEAFAGEMNTQAQRLGMRESYFVNPNGLPDDRQVSSARDMATVARALYREFPEQHGIFGIGALRLGDTIIRTHNGLLGRYPGADGMKTGFTCAAGFNVVATATRNGRHMIAVVLGAPSARERTAKAVELLETGFAGGSPQGTLDSLSSHGPGSAPNLRGDVCGRHRKAVMTEETEDAPVAPPLAYQSNPERPEREIYLSQGNTAVVHIDGHAVAALPRPYFDPIPVYIGRAPGWNGPAPVVASDDKANAAPAQPRVEARATKAKGRPVLAAKRLRLRSKTALNAKPATTKAALHGKAKQRVKTVANTPKKKTKGAVLPPKGKTSTDGHKRPSHSAVNE